MKHVCALLVVIGVQCSEVAVARTFTNVGTPELVQSITVFPPQGIVPLPSDFGSIDILFTNNVELPASLEAEFLLYDEPLPPALPRCTCEGFANEPLDFTALGQFYLAYYAFLDIPGSNIGQIQDGLLLRLKDDKLCVHAVRKTTFPVPVMTISPIADCMKEVLVSPPVPSIRRLQRMLKINLPPLDKDIVKPPDPICLSCPPWPTYVAERARFDRMHRDHIQQELTKTTAAIRRWRK